MILKQVLQLNCCCLSHSITLDTQRWEKAGPLVYSHPNQSRSLFMKVLLTCVALLMSVCFIGCCRSKTVYFHKISLPLYTVQYSWTYLHAWCFFLIFYVCMYCALQHLYYTSILWHRNNKCDRWHRWHHHNKGSNAGFFLPYMPWLTWITTLAHVQ